MEWGSRIRNALLRSDHDPQIYCQPKHPALTGSQIMLMLHKLVEADPGKGKAPLGLAMLIALIRTFPCRQDEAHADAAVVANSYARWSERTRGALGSAEDLYLKEHPEIRTAQGKPVPAATPDAACHSPGSAYRRHHRAQRRGVYRDRTRSRPSQTRGGRGCPAQDR